MLRVSKMADYGTVIMALMAKEESRVFSASDLANVTKISLPTVSNLLKKLTKSDLLHSTRGPSGGYQLKRPAMQISVYEIIAAIEDKLGLTECSEKDSQCSLQAACPTKASWRVINRVVGDALRAVSLRSLANECVAPNHEVPLTFNLVSDN